MKDKIKEEFEKQYGISHDGNSSHIIVFESGYHAGYKSRDDKIEDLKDGLMAMRALNKAAINNLKSRDEEIEKLKKFEKIDKVRREEGLAEIETYKRNIKHLEGINNDCVKEIDKQVAEIKKLREALDLLIHNISVNERGSGTRKVRRITNELILLQEIT